MQAWLSWGLQATTLMGLVGLLFYVRRRRQEDNQARLTACLNVVESRAEELERASEVYRRKMEDAIKRLSNICDKAATLVDRGFEFNAFSPSEEERELKTIVPDSKDEIPSIKEIERTRHRLREELKVDKIQVLRDQLS